MGEAHRTTAQAASAMAVHPWGFKTRSVDGG